MSRLNVDALEVSSFETTTPQESASTISNNPLCDSPWCAQTIDRGCPEADAAKGY